MRDLVALLARQLNISEAQAADQLQELVHEVVQTLRKGRPARIKGLGRFAPGQPIRFDPEKKARSYGKRS
jgi:nucleoid DNA-binding protein